MELLDDRPLAGLRIALTRAADAGDAWAGVLRSAGAVVHEVPLTRIERFPIAPLVAALGAMAAGDLLVVTSANGARGVADALAARGAPLLPGVRVAAVGPATARALGAAGLSVDLVPAQHDADGLVRALTAAMPLGEVSCVFPCALEARPTVVDALTAAGARVHAVPCYASRPDPAGEARLTALVADGAIDLLLLAAPSAVRAARRALSSVMPVPCVAIGPVTATSARDAGFMVRAVAAQATTTALVQAIAAARAPIHPVVTPSIP
ncbi:MAG: uroporphyrinogen-III synthase [Gemmatimonadaceae bacterium]|nr:uroporphyrinogen-III synthase [Gemmatimonadaceae bacterium]